MKVVCIGSGNVATRLCIALKKSGAELLQIWSKQPENAAALAAVVDAEAISVISQVVRSADLYVIAVKDDFIPEMVDALTGVNGLVVHTSGATDINILSSFKLHGVLYPLQTFSKTRPVTFQEVPLCLEAVDIPVMDQLKRIANLLGGPVYEVDSKKRKILHLSAVFACNFVNHLYGIGHDILNKHNLDFEMIRPLIMETAIKVQQDFPSNVQTGPAVRDDEQTMSKHLGLLEDEPQLQEIYRLLSKSIKKTDQ
jgi:predicted short-subunit dehydrogenase-like oxidoreductase (DUF2520 family)